MNDIESSNLLLNNSELIPLNINENHETNLEISNTNNQLLFIDSAVKDYQLLINNLTEQVEVIIVDSQKDGVIQITETLRQYDSLDAVHIVSHGDSGELFLGNTTLNQDNLSEYQNELNSWGNAIEEEGDILLYGCNVAADLSGVKFVEELSEYTKSDIQASDDNTGSRELDGDWQLEYATGDIKTELIFDDEIAEVYSYIFNQSYYNDEVFERTFTIDRNIPSFENGFSGGFRVDFYQVSNDFISEDIQNPIIDFDLDIIDSGFHLDYTPEGLEIRDSTFNPEMKVVDFPQAENQPFTLNFGEPNFTKIRPYDPDYNYDDGTTNHILYPFPSTALGFNADNYDFTSIEVREKEKNDYTDTIIFKFDSGTFDFSSLTSNNSLTFNFYSGADEIYGINYNLNSANVIRIGNELSFKPSAVTFRSDSISFDYEPERNFGSTILDRAEFNSNLNRFSENANLFKHKFSASDFNRGISLEQLNASDFRALDYAFEGDEIFDFTHYNSQATMPSGMNPYTDYIENGWKAGLDPHPLFDVDYYLSNNTDVRDNGAEPLKHYTTIGFSEANPNRDPHPLFDTSYYNENNTDVVSANKSPLSHYVETGFTENLDSRDPNRYFDSSYYNANNPDVVAEGVNPLTHYIQFGWRESIPENPFGTNPNRDPNPLFDTEFYYEAHPDVKAEILQDSEFFLKPLEYYSANALQHYIEFGDEGKFAVEGRVTHSIYQGENQVAFKTFIDAESEGFEFAQKAFGDIGYELTPGEQGEILVAGVGILIPFVIQKGIEYAIYTGIAYQAADLLDVPEGVLTLYESLTQTTLYETLSIGLDNLFTGTPPFDGDLIESTPQIETFPRGNTLENLLDLNGRFYTPLDPINELAENVESFPRRDEILDNLLNEPLVFPDRQIPTGTYAYPTRISSEDVPDWSDDYRNGENPNITFDSPSQTAIEREAEIRNEVATSTFVNGKTRTKYSDPRGGNIAFADYTINQTTGFKKGYAGSPKSIADKVNDIPGFAKYVSPEQRTIESFVAKGFNRAVDPESKILEEIFVELVQPGVSGNITLYSTNPLCPGCGMAVIDFLNKTQEIGANITIEIIEIRSKNNPN